MRARSLRAICAALVAVACAGQLDAPPPSPRAVEPSRGWAGGRTAVVIRGDGFLARTRSTSGGAEVDATQRAWLGGAELEDVVRVDAQTLRATVPAGLPAGLLPLVVENAFGLRGHLDAAFEVVAAPGASLSVTLDPAAAAATVGQQLAIRATVANLGTAPALGVSVVLAPSPANAVVVAGPVPATVPAIAPGESATVAWSLVAAAEGEVSLAAIATATDELSARSVESPAAAAALTIRLPAGLAATIRASRSTAGTRQPVGVELTVTNGGGAAAELREVAPSAEGVPGASCGPTTPATPQALDPGASATFAWTCSAPEPGLLVLGATASGVDATSGAQLTATPAAPAVVTIQAAAALAATLSFPGSSTVNVGQPLALALAVANEGGSDAEVTEVTPTVTPAGAAACGAPDPRPPRLVTAGGSTAFAWTCTPAAPGSVTFGAIVAGADGNTGAPLAAPSGPGVGAIVQLPAALTAVVSARPTLASVGQPVTVSFVVANGGTATADLTSLEPAVSGAGAPPCSAVAPAPPQLLAAGQAVTFGWTCTPTSPGELVLSGTAAGVDANSGAPVTATPVAPAAVTVQAPAALAVTSFTAGDALAAVGQAVSLELTIANAGEASADVAAIAPSASPAATANCSEVTPAPPVTIAGGASRTFAWACAASAPGSYGFGASVTAADANSGAATPVSVPPVAVEFRVPAGLAAAVATDRGVATTGQDVAVSFTVVNGGVGPATITSVAPSASGAGTACGPVVPGLPRTLAAGESLVFGWTCTPAVAGLALLSGSAEGTDELGEPLSASPPDGAAVVVQEPPALAVRSFTATRTSANVGQEVGVALTLANDGGATAGISRLVPSVDPASVASCTGPSPAAPASLPGGGSITFAWSCAGVAPAAASLGAAIAAADANTGASAAVDVVPLTVTFEAPAALAVASFSATPAAVGQPFEVTLVLADTGGAAADVSAVSRSATPGSGITCSEPAPAAPQRVAGGAALAFRWTCTASSARSYTVRATVAATDANTGAALAVAVPSLAVAVARAP